MGGKKEVIIYQYTAVKQLGKANAGTPSGSPTPSSQM
jgi:hypothetical protein